MTTIYEVPTTGSTPERFQIDLGETGYELLLRWNPALPAWTLDIHTQAGAPLVQGITLVPGADLLEQHRHLGITGRLEVRVAPYDETNPTFENLGSTSRLYFLVD